MEKENITDVSIYIAALQTTFKPANCPKEATHWFTTEEVYNAIKKLDPACKIERDQVYQGMIDAGFKFEPRPGTQSLDFRWMLQAKVK